MNISENDKKMQLVSRLVREGAIDFEEALLLLEKELEWASPPFLPYPVYPGTDYPSLPLYPTIDGPTWQTSN
jgi:hypothetical protein